ncbi:ribonuclease P protein component [Oscillatoria laete-virens NRMC-F 0139]|nr:ribonuclease P protein component [Oscillatoria laete-virens]MDL5055082.1 ribonuclease P protein component [Oscillatoria laete-virens NRMC-F 0139]
MRLTFPKSARLQTRAEFDLVKQTGTRATGRCLILNVTKEQAGRALGIVTTKKLGPAHQRSRARRLIRESFRLNQHRIISDCHIVAVARREILTANQKTVENEFVRLCQKLEIWAS